MKLPNLSNGSLQESKMNINYALRRERIKEDDIPCLLSTSINAVNAVPPTVHSSTGAFKLPT